MFDHVWPSFFAEINVASLCVTLYPSPIHPLLMWSRCRSWWHLNLPQSHLGSGWANFGWRTNQQQGQMVRTSMCNKSGQNWTWKQADADLGSQVTGHRRMQLPFAVASGPHFLELGIIQGILDLCILCIFFSTKKAIHSHPMFGYWPRFTPFFQVFSMAFSSDGGDPSPGYPSLLLILKSSTMASQNFPTRGWCLGGRHYRHETRLGSFP